MRCGVIASVADQISNDRLRRAFSIHPPAAMASKRFSIANMEAQGSVRKQARLEGNPALVAAIRPWGSAFWVFEGQDPSLEKTFVMYCIDACP